MEIGDKIKGFRKVHKLSQEDLADKIYVSRQTVSNWETNKRYPDIQNLILLSVIFDVSVDELIKGDLDAMKAKLSDKKTNVTMSVYTYVMMLAALLGAISMGLVFYFEQSTFIIVVPIVCFTIMLFSSFKVEQLKNSKNLKTFAEIVAFTSGENVEEQRQKRNRSADMLEKVMIVGGFIGVFLIIALISIFIFSVFK